MCDGFSELRENSPAGKEKGRIIRSTCMPCVVAPQIVRLSWIQR